jgi:hypothetical protein
VLYEAEIEVSVREGYLSFSDSEPWLRAYDGVSVIGSVRLIK